MIQLDSNSIQMIFGKSKSELAVEGATAAAVATQAGLRFSEQVESLADKMYKNQPDGGKTWDECYDLAVKKIEDNASRAASLSRLFTI
jgi:hypothetical protein